MAAVAGSHSGLINHQYKEWDEKNPQLATCNKDTKNIIQGSTVPQEVDTDKEVVFTYDVSYKESDIKWASRWDTYLLMNDDQIHWFSIIKSLMIMVTMVGHLPPIASSDYGDNGTPMTQGGTE